MSMRDFNDWIGGFTFYGQTLGKAIGERLDVPYYSDREFMREPHYPDSCNGVAEAVAKLPYGITGAYFNVPSLNLVLIGPFGEKIGIRAMSLRMEPADPLERLKKAATS